MGIFPTPAFLTPDLKAGRAAFNAYKAIDINDAVHCCTLKGDLGEEKEEQYYVKRRRSR